MDSRARAIAIVAALGTASLASGSASASTGAPAASLSGHAWGKAIEVPGITALGGPGAIISVSCASAGNCGAGGDYLNSFRQTQAFVVSQVNGTWGKAIEVPGTAALNQGGFAVIDSVSCASAGNCSAGGDYADSSGRQAFVVSQVNGTWGKAIEVPGTAALNQGGFAVIDSVSCASAGNCSAGGTYANSSASIQAFVVREVNGAWGRAIEAPGTAALNQGGDARIDSVSCVSAGNCGAGGFYTDSSGHEQVFVASEVNGSWGKAIEVPGTAALNHGNANIDSVSCGSAGNCGAGGIYRDHSFRSQVFVASEVNGSWGKAIEVPGTAALNQGGNATINPLSCASAGNCSAGGSYRDSSGHFQAFVVGEVNGTWHTAIEVPGIAALNQGDFAEIASVSCASAGNCSAGGTYADSSRQTQAFVVSQVNGTWHTAIEAPGTAALNQGGDARIDSVSCASAGECSAGGTTAGGDGAFVVSET